VPRLCVMKAGAVEVLTKPSTIRCCSTRSTRRSSASALRGPARRVAPPPQPLRHPDGTGA
jgi:hypothetical protein